MMADPLLARALVRLYPPAWRARYEDELLALLADTGMSARAALGLVRGAAAAWVRPPQHLFDRAARARTSISVTLSASTAIVAALLIYGQLYEDQLRIADHRATSALFRACQVAGAASVAALLLGAAPLAWQLLRDSARRRARRELVLLSLPVTASLAFLAVLLVVTAVRSGPDGIGTAWFLAVSALGLAAAVAVVAGPLAVLRRSAPAGPALRLAVRAASVATAVLALAAATSIADLVTLDRLTSVHTPMNTPPGALAAYAVALVALLTTAGVSAARGLRAIAR